MESSLSHGVASLDLNGSVDELSEQLTVDNVNEKDSHGDTPLHKVITRERWDLVHVLVAWSMELCMEWM